MRPPYARRTSAGTDPRLHDDWQQVLSWRVLFSSRMLHGARRALHVARRAMHVARRAMHGARRALHVARRALHVARLTSW